MSPFKKENYGYLCSFLKRCFVRLAGRGGAGRGKSGVILARPGRQGAGWRGPPIQTMPGSARPREGRIAQAEARLGQARRSGDGAVQGLAWPRAPAETRWARAARAYLSNPRRVGPRLALGPRGLLPRLWPALAPSVALLQECVTKPRSCYGLPYIVTSFCLHPGDLVSEGVAPQLGSLACTAVEDSLLTGCVGQTPQESGETT